MSSRLSAKSHKTDDITDFLIYYLFIFYKIYFLILKKEYKSKKLDHFHLHAVIIFLFQSFNKNFSALLTFL